ncbi:hypothetical protein HED60_10340 [Planctomycetales bacterium ZRK34]|nr:hypothetical protein HED60_10340 [Planctomycetales bacterium ZRK34]
MQDTERLLEELLDVLERLDFDIRRLPMGGDGGGIAQVRNRWTAFVDTQAAPLDLLQQLISQLDKSVDPDTIYLSPALRDLFDA